MTKKNNRHQDDAHSRLAFDVKQGLGQVSSTTSLSFFLPLALSLLKPLHRSYLKVHGQCVQVCLVIEHARRVTHPYFPHVKSGVGPTQSEPPQKKLARRENVSVRGRVCSFL